MAVSQPVLTQLGPTRFRLDYTSDLGGTPTFYIYLMAELIATTTATFYEFTVPAGNQVQIEVFDDVGDVPEEAFDSSALLRWGGVSGAAQYRVKQYESAAWVVKGVVLANASDVYQFRTAMLADCVTHQFQVVPVDANGVEGDVLAMDIEMVRYPDTPDQTAAWSDGLEELVIG